MTDSAAINLRKILVVPVVASFMLVHGNGSLEAWLYLGLHRGRHTLGSALVMASSRYGVEEVQRGSRE